MCPRFGLVTIYGLSPLARVGVMSPWAGDGGLAGVRRIGSPSTIPH